MIIGACQQGAAAILVITIVYAQVASAQVYKWVDEQGRVHYTDQLVEETEGMEAIDLPINTYTAPEILDSGYLTSQVVMYSTSWCPVCKTAKRYLRKKGIAFVEYDIEKNEKAKREYRALGASGVPVILVGDKRLNGFSEKTFDKLYY